MAPKRLPSGVGQGRTSRELDADQKKGGKVIRSERYFGKVERSFTLPQDIDEAAVSAKYEDGVLKLVLPLREKGAGKNIKIS